MTTPELVPARRHNDTPTPPMNTGTAAPVADSSGGTTVSYQADEGPPPPTPSRYEWSVPPPPAQHPASRPSLGATRAGGLQSTPASSKAAGSLRGSPAQTLNMVTACTEEPLLLKAKMGPGAPAGGEADIGWWRHRFHFCILVVRCRHSVQVVMWRCDWEYRL